MFVVFSGPSCVGKTAVSRILMTRLAAPCLLIEADRYIPFFNDAANPTSANGSKQVVLALHRSIAAWADDDWTVIVDGSLPFENAELITACLEALGPDTRTVALTSEPDELRRRFIVRGAAGDLNRTLRQQETLPDLVPADLAVDCTHLTSVAVADTVAAWLAR
ncbi:phosphotransferase-like protein [Nakamurella lactea]|uniref:phosphotransferase-like protein n=1 Tax=Nakamurella lactea TaxID=459515 RepID=UPI00040621B2|nr:AAA family ATPase [Nakamurella lactea]